MKISTIRKNDSLMIKVSDKPSMVFGNCYFALIYFNDGQFDIEYFRENNTGYTCINVKYFVSDLKKAIKIAQQSMNYLNNL